MSAATCTRTWPWPTMLATIDSMRWRMRSSKSVVFCSSLSAVASSPVFSWPPANKLPRSSMMATRSGESEATAAATRCWIACTWPRARTARVLTTTEALGVCASCEKIWRSGMTRCTRTLSMPSMVWMDRASSPSSARRRLMFCTKAVVPKASDLSKIS